MKFSLLLITYDITATVVKGEVGFAIGRLLAATLPRRNGVGRLRRFHACFYCRVWWAGLDHLRIKI
jgi:hypothetical protein